jgi:hypothetical protein
LAKCHRSFYARTAADAVFNVQPGRHESRRLVRRSIRCIQCRTCFDPGGSDRPRQNDRKKSRTEYPADLISFHQIPRDNTPMRGRMLPCDSHKKSGFGYTAILSAILIVQDENLLAGVERLSRCAIPLSSGAAGENEKTGSPCRAIEIVAVMRLTTSSARLESNVPERDSILPGFGTHQSKMSDREELKSRIVAVGSRPGGLFHASRIRPIKP